MLSLLVSCSVRLMPVSAFQIPSNPYSPLPFPGVDGELNGEVLTLAVRSRIAIGNHPTFDPIVPRARYLGLRGALFVCACAANGSVADTATQHASSESTAADWRCDVRSPA